MNEAALQRRLDAIERRQRLVLALLVLPYHAVGVSLLVGAFDVGSRIVAIIGVVMLLVALLYSCCHARRPSTSRTSRGCGYISPSRGGSRVRVRPPNALIRSRGDYDSGSTGTASCRKRR